MEICYLLYGGSSRTSLPFIGCSWKASEFASIPLGFKNLLIWCRHMVCKSFKRLWELSCDRAIPFGFKISILIIRTITLLLGSLDRPSFREDGAWYLLLSLAIISSVCLGVNILAILIAAFHSSHYPWPTYIVPSTIFPTISATPSFSDPIISLSIVWYLIGR